MKCDKLNTPDNVIMSGCGRASISYGDKCLFYCEHGYKAVSGTKERHCQEDGTWSGSPLACAGEFSIVTRTQRPGFGPRMKLRSGPRIGTRTGPR